MARRQKAIKLVNPFGIPPEGATAVLCEPVSTTKVRGQSGAFWVVKTFYSEWADAVAAFDRSTQAGHASAIFDLECDSPSIKLIPGVAQ